MSRCLRPRLLNNPKSLTLTHDTMRLCNASRRVSLEESEKQRPINPLHLTTILLALRRGSILEETKAFSPQALRVAGGAETERQKENKQKKETFIQLKRLQWNRVHLDKPKILCALQRRPRWLTRRGCMAGRDFGHSHPLLSLSQPFFSRPLLSCCCCCGCIHSQTLPVPFK